MDFLAKLSGSSLARFSGRCESLDSQDRREDKR